MKAARGDVWKDAFEMNPDLLASMQKMYGNALTAISASGKVQQIYSNLSTDIHNPGLEHVPIRLRQLEEPAVRLMVALCRRYPIQYQVYDEENRPVDNKLYEEA